MNQLIEDNMYGFLTCVGRKHHRVNDEDNLLSVSSGIDHGLFNYVAAAKTCPSAAAANRVIHAFTEQSIPFSWISFPSVGNRANAMLEQSFNLVSAGAAVGQVFNLKKPIPTSEDIGVKIHIAETEDDFDAWDAISAVCFEHPIGIAKRFLFPEGATSVAAEIKFFLATAEGKAVGASIFYSSNDSVGLYWTSVLPAARNRRVYSELVKARLTHAAELGARYACVQTMPMSRRACNRLGFEEHGTFALYHQRPSS